MQLLTLLGEKNNLMNFELANQQRSLAQSSRRDDETMKIVALLGAAFLPGTFVASIFSTSFFEFQPGKLPFI
jgi:Mg2+ and Co2+ transporter CorA